MSNACRTGIRSSSGFQALRYYRNCTYGKCQEERGATFVGRRDGMPRRIIDLAAVLLMVSISVVCVHAAERDVKGSAESFLIKAAEAQLVEIAMGVLVTQRGENERVKEFAAQMAADHMKASRQLEELASKKGVTLPPGLSGGQRRSINELSLLSGHAFDRAYLSYIIQHHADNVEEFGRDAKTLQDLDARQWASSILPLVEAHREKARSVQYSLQTRPIK